MHLIAIIVTSGVGALLAASLATAKARAQKALVPVRIRSRAEPRRD